MSSSSFTVESSYDGLELKCQQFLPEESFKHMVLVVHGYGEHSEYYPPGYQISNSNRQ